jgi:oligopeptide transport system substrate-binding protein
MSKRARRLPLTGLLAAALLLGSVSALADPVPARIQLRYELSSLDPHKFDGLEEYRVAVDLFEGLTTYSATDTVLPGVATSWETSEDGLVWTFHLRPDAVWSDGTPLSAEDFLYSFRRALDPATASPYVLALLPIVNAGEISAGKEKDLTKLGVAAVDPHTLRITLTRQTPWFLALLTGQAAMPVPRQAIEKWGDQWTQPAHMVTNGAFILKNWIPLGEIDLARNPRFRDAASVKLPEVDYVLADDTKAALKRYEAGELDVTAVLGQDLPRMQRERPTELRSYPLLATGYFTVNMGRAFGGDARVRQALAMVIDRDVLDKQVVRRGQLAAYGLIPPSMPNYTAQLPDWAELPMPERIKRARQLLVDAGVTAPLKVHVLGPKQDVSQLYTRAIFEMWRTALGVESEEEAIEPRIFDGRVTHHDFEFAFHSWYADYADPWTFFANYRTDAADLNYGSYSNPKYDALLEQSRTIADPAQRMAVLEQAERLLLADQPVIPIDFLVTQSLVSARLRGYENAPLGVHPDRFLSLVEERG